jgi:hypothetical protein
LGQGNPLKGRVRKAIGLKQFDSQGVGFSGWVATEIVSNPLGL